MEENSSFKSMHQTIQSLSRDAVAVTFRRRRLIRKAFVWSLLGGILAVMLFGILYESDSEIAVRPWTRRRARGIDGIHGDAIHLGDVVTEDAQNPVRSAAMNSSAVT